MGLQLIAVIFTKPYWHVLLLGRVFKEKQKLMGRQVWEDVEHRKCTNTMGSEIWECKIFKGLSTRREAEIMLNREEFQKRKIKNGKKVVNHAYEFSYLP